MLRSLPIVLAAAAVVVLAFLALEPGLFVGPGSLEAPAETPGLQARADLGPRQASEEDRAGATGRETPASAAPAAGAGAATVDAAHGTAGEAVTDLLRVTVGFSPEEINRTFRKEMTRALHTLREECRRDPATLDYLLRRFEEVDDLGFRYALTWLFRFVPDDRVVGPVASLAGRMPVEVTDTLADIGTEKAFKTLAALDSVIEDPRARRQLLARLGRSTWKDADVFLERVWTDVERPDDERFAAVLALGHRPPREALHRALSVALGDAVPLDELHDPNGTLPVKDLRQGAAMAVMSLGDQDAVRRLLDEADRRGDEDFAAIVDRALVRYQGPDITSFLLKRVEDRSLVTWGEANYLQRRATPKDVELLKSLVRFAADDRTKDALEAAVVHLDVAELMRRIERRGGPVSWDEAAYLLPRATTDDIGILRELLRRAADDRTRGAIRDAIERLEFEKRHGKR